MLKHVLTYGRHAIAPHTAGLTATANESPRLLGWLIATEENLKFRGTDGARHTPCGAESRSKARHEPHALCSHRRSVADDDDVLDPDAVPPVGVVTGL